MEFQKVFGIITAFLEKERCLFAVIGAFGLHAYGLTRATFDLDLNDPSRTFQEMADIQFLLKCCLPYPGSLSSAPVRFFLDNIGLASFLLGSTVFRYHRKRFTR